MYLFYVHSIFFVCFSVYFHLLKVLSKSVLECLRRAAANQHRSIAFPAIGTGGLGLGKEEAALIMSDAVADFAQNPQNVMDVAFVIYPSDNPTYKVVLQQQCHNIENVGG